IIEHFDGKFPTWLAPDQVRVLPISDHNVEYARSVAEDLDGIRATVEDRSWTIGRKIQEAHSDRVPYMVIVGSDEEEAGTIAVRDRAEREVRDVAIEDFHDHLASEIAEKRTTPDFLE
ncbi:MAG: His/Gly/Thr/Pro-type tRNA ligase C-terminal domain-containing protein, partial [Halobacteriales archaeon]|nr:His/Gly/Thr/Pro-type tRNA ligase C-terminal domain-containing protein [Halobacteriales archaeon]